MRRRGGTVCIIWGCSTKTGGNMSMFCLVKDPTRLALWLKAAGREDLLKRNAEELHKNCKICELHFEDRFIVQGKSRKHLFDNAVPTIFPHATQLPATQVPATTIKSETESPSKCTVISNISSRWAEESSSETNVSIQTCATGVIPGPATTSSVAIQTHASLNSASPRNRKLRANISSLKRHIHAQRRHVNKMLTTKEKWTIRDFHKMCKQFLSQPLAEFVIAQSLLKEDPMGG